MEMIQRGKSVTLWIGLVFLLVGGFSLPRVYAEDTPAPVSVTISGNLQSTIGCPGDWDPSCPAAHLTYDSNDDVWQGVWTIPPGNWEYKAALNDSWAENYGANALRDGPNI